jgi:hypothetical protein
MVENEEQLDKYLAVEEQLPNIHTVVVLDSTGLADLDHPKVVMLEQFYRLGDEGDEDEGDEQGTANAERKELPSDLPAQPVTQPPASMQATRPPKPPHPKCRPPLSSGILFTVSDIQAEAPFFAISGLIILT